jgi:hypothetical protein
MSNAAQTLTVISLAIAIIGAIGGFTWKISRALNRLLELPTKVDMVVSELHEMNNRIAGVRGESESWRKESSDWHREHMRTQHRRPNREGR